MVFFVLILIGFVAVRYDFLYRLNRIETKLLLNEQESDLNRKEVNTRIKAPAEGAIVVPRSKVTQPIPANSKRFIVFECKSLCGGWADRLKGLY